MRQLFLAGAALSLLALATPASAMPIGKIAPGLVNDEAGVVQVYYRHYRYYRPRAYYYHPHYYHPYYYHPHVYYGGGPYYGGGYYGGGPSISFSFGGW